MWIVLATLFAVLQYVACINNMHSCWRGGLPKLLTASPLIFLTLAIPFSLQKATLRGSVAFVTNWLACFKLLAAAFGRGPLTNKDLTLLQHVALLLLPLNPAGTGQSGGVYQHHKSSTGATKTQHALVNSSAGHQVLYKLVAAAGVILLLHHGPWISTFFRHILYAVIVWLTVAILVDVPSSFIGPVLGINLSPAMAAPYKAVGLSDFWGKRYNLVVSSTLRFAVFEPVQQLLQCSESSSNTTAAPAARACKRYSKGRKGQQFGTEQWCSSCQVAHAVATAAAFLVSGLMHELCVWHMCQTSYAQPGVFLPGRHLLFFLLQAPLVLLEKHLTRTHTGRPGATLSAAGMQGNVQALVIAAAAMDKLGAAHSSAADAQPRQLAVGGSSSSSNSVICAAQNQQGSRNSEGDRSSSSSSSSSSSKTYGVRWARSLGARHLGDDRRAWELAHIALTYVVLFVLAEYLFWPPLEQCKADVNGIAEISDGLQYVKHWLLKASLP